MAIALRAAGPVVDATASGGASTILNSVFPTDWQPGDIAICVAGHYTYASDVSLNGTFTFATQAGWTLLWSQGSMFVFWRRLQSGDVAPQFTVRSLSTRNGFGKVVHVAYSGASAATNPFSAASTTSGGAAACNVPAYKISADGVAFNLLVGGYSPAWSTLTGTTELYDSPGPPTASPGALALDAVFLASGATRAAGVCQTDSVTRSGTFSYQVTFALYAATDGGTAPSKGTINVNAGGTWKSAQALWVNSAGTWKQAQSAWVNSGGTWKQVL